MMKVWQILTVVGLALFLMIGAFTSIGVVIWLLVARVSQQTNSTVVTKKLTVQAPTTNPPMPIAHPGIGMNPPLMARPLELDDNVENSNDLIKSHRAQIKVTASSQWSGIWSAQSAVDGVQTTTWFSQESGIRRQPGQNAWIRLEFPEEVTISHVTVVNNRDKAWRTYDIVSGTIELLDADDQIIARESPEPTATKRDFDWMLPEAKEGVRSIRFAGRGSGQDIAVTEILAE
jgi:hypothetical protein